MTEYFIIGKLVAASGLKGEMILKHTLGKKSALKDLNAIFIEDRKDSFIPWFIQSAKAKSETEIILKLEGVNSREDAINLTQKQVWLREEDFRKYAAKSSPVNMLGYILIDNNKALGEILELIEQPHQLLCRLEINTKEVLIPLNEDTLLKVDNRKKQVLVNLPDGLLEIYLG